ncbi:hypothetical protein KNE206_58760 [Kitasatospora sp. NE20-6]
MRSLGSGTSTAGGAPGRCHARGTPDHARSGPGGRGGSPGRWDAYGVRGLPAVAGRDRAGGTQILAGAVVKEGMAFSFVTCIAAPGPGGIRADRWWRRSGQGAPQWALRAGAVMGGVGGGRVRPVVRGGGAGTREVGHDAW